MTLASGLSRVVWEKITAQQVPSSLQLIAVCSEYLRLQLYEGARRVAVIYALGNGTDLFTGQLAHPYDYGNPLLKLAPPHTKTKLKVRAARSDNSILDGSCRISPHLAEHIFVRPRGIGLKYIFRDNFARPILSLYSLIILLLYILSSAYTC